MAVASVDVGTASHAAGDRPRINHLDGLRGLAALYVAIHHAAFGMPGEVLGRPGWLKLALKPLAYGHYAVPIFIVLSGYCLMLPVVRSAAPRLSGGFLSYIGRRARRILPPYYTALVLSVATIYLLTWLARITNNPVPYVYYQISAPIILSHLLLVHNLSNAWNKGIDVPMWSVATEWQIYFLFPLILLPVYRRFGAIAAIVAGFMLGALPYLTPFGRYVLGADYWYIGLFAIGMVAAALNFSASPRLTAIRERVSWPIATAVSAILVVIIAVCLPGYGTTQPWVIDPCVGLCAATLMVGLADPMSERQFAPARKILNSPAVRRLGRFSYSLYLMHFPVLLTLYMAAGYLIRSPKVLFLLSMLVGLPLAILCSYLLYLAVERRFTRG